MFHFYIPEGTTTTPTKAAKQIPSGKKVKHHTHLKMAM
jgi:hypothetical protein